VPSISSRPRGARRLLALALTLSLAGCDDADPTGEAPATGSDDAGATASPAPVEPAKPSAPLDASTALDARTPGESQPEIVVDAGTIPSDAAAYGTLSADAEVAPPVPGAMLDLLFVIDNSGSMASEQERLRRELPNMIRVLTLGDRTPDLPAESSRSNGARYFTPVRDLHLGVVTTNLGGIDDPSGTSEAINACRGLGDDAKLQSSTSIAVAGVVASTEREFEGYGANEVVLPPEPGCSRAALPSYQSFEAGKPPSAEEVAASFGCIARVGVRGCPFEQPLEAMWKALAPATPPAGATNSELYTFLNDSRGQGTRANSGFLREEALLAVLHVSDEEDCSIKQAGKPLFDNRRGGEAEMKYGVAINMRCGLYGEAEGLVWPVERYVEGLRSLKPGHPERLVFGALVGVPTDVVSTTNLDELLARPELQFGEEGTTGLPRTSCTRANRDPAHPERSDKASPPRRFVQVAKGLGSNAVLHSICADDYAPVLRSLTEKIARAM